MTPILFHILIEYDSEIFFHVSFDPQLTSDVIKMASELKIPICILLRQHIYGKCWYVLAETIFYKCSWYYSSFDKGIMAFLRLKEACQFFTFTVYSLWDMTFSQNSIYIPVFREQYLRRFSFIYAELRVCCSWDKKLSQMYPLFCLNFLLDQPTYTCSKQVLTNLVYFSYFDPLFCEQDNLKMVQSNTLKFSTHM